MLIRSVTGALAIGLLASTAWVNSAEAQPCGYPPFPPCGPPGYRPPPPPPPPPPYVPPRPGYGGGYGYQAPLSYRCKVNGPDCEMNRPRPIGSYCRCRGRNGVVAPD